MKSPITGKQDARKAIHINCAKENKDRYNCIEEQSKESNVRVLKNNSNEVEGSRCIKGDNGMLHFNKKEICEFAKTVWKES